MPLRYHKYINIEKYPTFIEDVSKRYSMPQWRNLYSRCKDVM